MRSASSTFCAQPLATSSIANLLMQVRPGVARHLKQQEHEKHDDQYHDGAGWTGTQGQSGPGFRRPTASTTAGLRRCQVRDRGCRPLIRDLSASPLDLSVGPTWVCFVVPRGCPDHISDVLARAPLACAREGALKPTRRGPPIVSSEMAEVPGPPAHQGSAPR